MTRLRVTGMTCGHCEMTVRDALSKVTGVTRVVDVSRERNEAIVEGETKTEALIDAVRNQGYQAEAAI